MKQLKREAKAGDATAQQELDNERIRFFSRQAPAWKKVLLALVTGLIISLRVHVLACSAHPLWQQFVTSDQ